MGFKAHACPWGTMYMYSTIDIVLIPPNPTNPPSLFLPTSTNDQKLFLWKNTECRNISQCNSPLLYGNKMSKKGGD